MDVNNPFALYKWQALFDARDIFIGGLITTLEVTIGALVLSILLGIIFGIAGVFPNKIIRVINRIYVEFFQNTPLVIQVIFIYNALPHLHIMLPVLLIGILGVGLYTGAYMAEVVRGGIMAVPKGQLEAAVSQGFSYWQAMWYIVLPQAKKVMLPAMANQTINLVKNTSVLAMIAGGDLMYQADSWSGSNMYYGPAYFVSGCCYWIICFALSKYINKLEKKAGV
ncbi:amino acid ABC transporter permease [Pectinatus brassicae]|uniref:Putative glutamine transport system permease protein n=1 Tax=Pectinatus brassicae TaxID=862415 RepID=A0A840UDS4_9FIRM|nr:amino acid ABC transporter permease [Pectinatus brassicae]MBB5335871.1 putative glutamine transport system permease protein [Pectinatus brassicae]